MSGRLNLGCEGINSSSSTARLISLYRSRCTLIQDRGMLRLCYKSLVTQIAARSVRNAWGKLRGSDPQIVRGDDRRGVSVRGGSRNRFSRVWIDSRLVWGPERPSNQTMPTRRVIKSKPSLYHSPLRGICSAPDPKSKRPTIYTVSERRPRQPFHAVPASFRLLCRRSPTPPRPTKLL